MDKLHWESYKQRDELELAHHLTYHQGEEIRNQGDEIKELKRMVRIALDSAQAAKGAVVQVLAEMTAMEMARTAWLPTIGDRQRDRARLRVRPARGECTR